MQPQIKKKKNAPLNAEEKPLLLRAKENLRITDTVILLVNLRDQLLLPGLDVPQAAGRDGGLRAAKPSSPPHQGALGRWCPAVALGLGCVGQRGCVRQPAPWLPPTLLVLWKMEVVIYFPAAESFLSVAF